MLTIALICGPEPVFLWSWKWIFGGGGVVTGFFVVVLVVGFLFALSFGVLLVCFFGVFLTFTHF